MRIQRSWVLSVLAITAVVMGVRHAEAQSHPGSGVATITDAVGAADAAAAYATVPSYAPGMPTMVPQSPNYQSPNYQGQRVAIGYGPPLPGAYGGAVPYGYQPAAYYGPANGAPPQALAPMSAAPINGGLSAGGYAEAGPGMGMCESCGGYGCETCMGGCDDFDFGLFKYLLPYGAGGYCAQRWFDVEAEYVYLQRDGMANSQAFSSLGQGGPIVLSMDDLEFDKQPGFRTTASVQLGAGDALEATYLGAFNWSSQAQVVDGNNNLFSVMSEFGTAPPGGFDDTDAAATHMIAYSSSFDTVEMNYRQRWVAANCRLQGSWLVGVRYMSLTEDFVYNTMSPGGTPGWMDYTIGSSNNMTGVQGGGDLWVCIIPGLHLGTEMKLGLYGNHARQMTNIQALSFIEPVVEDLKTNRTAFVGDINMTLLWRVSQNWTLRAGYMALYADGVALAPDSFNAKPPFVAGQRVPFVNASGNVFYHGLTAGLEWMW